MDVQDYENYLPKIIINLFEKNMPSNEILVSHEFPLSETIQEELEKKWDKKITLTNPKRGWKKDLLNTAIDDAKELRRVADLKRRSDLEFRSLSLEQLQHKLNLKKIPYRIEAYDISNLGDKFRVGSMVEWKTVSPNLPCIVNFTSSPSRDKMILDQWKKLYLDV